MEDFNIFTSFLTIFSFILSIAMWIISEKRKHALKLKDNEFKMQTNALKEVINSIHTISVDAIWDSQTVLSEAYETKSNVIRKELGFY